MHSTIVDTRNGLHSDAFNYKEPTGDQKRKLDEVSNAHKTLGDVITRNVPHGPDRDKAFQKLRECGMWTSVAITKNEDGSPKKDGYT